MTESTYDRICKQECEWCAKGMPFVTAIIRLGSAPIHEISRGNPAEYRRCTAPSRDEVIERLAKAIKQTIAENLHLADGDNCTLRHLVAADPEYGLQALAAEVERLQEPVKVTGMIESPHTISAKHDDCPVFSFAGLRSAYCPNCGSRLEWK